MTRWVLFCFFPLWFRFAQIVITLNLHNCYTADFTSVVFISEPLNSLVCERVTVLNLPPASSHHRLCNNSAGCEIGAGAREELPRDLARCL